MPERRPAHFGRLADCRDGAVVLGVVVGPPVRGKASGQAGQAQDLDWEKIQSWALEVFFNFSMIKNDFFAFLIKLITYFGTTPI